MRRLRLIVLLASIVSLLLGPTAGSSQAQLENEHGWRVDGIVTGVTDPPEDPEGHALFLNRVAGPSRFGGFEILATFDCETSDNEREYVVARLQQDTGHFVDFFADDDITDGYGEVSQTEDDRVFRSAAGAVETRVPPQLDDPAPARANVRIVEGRFHRLLGVVEVDLRLDIRIDRNPDTPQERQICQTESDREVEIRIVFVLAPDENVDPNEPLSGFRLTGVATRHGSDVPRDSVARKVCGLVTPHSVRVTTTTAPDPVPPPPQGRGDFHPCPPEGQQTS